MESVLIEKTVLVCYKDRKRPVIFQCNGQGSEKEHLVSAIRETYQDLLPEDCTLAIQIKNESWYGNFVDLGEEAIEDRSVVQLVVEVSRDKSIMYGSRKLC